MDTLFRPARTTKSAGIERDPQRAERAIRHRPRRLRTPPAIAGDGRGDEPRAAAADLAAVRGRGPHASRGRSARCRASSSTRWTRLRKAAVEAADAGLAGVMLFGIPEHKDAVGSGALDPDGILNVAIRAVREEVGDDCLVMSDVCLDEFTDHGHCGVLTPSGAVDNDATWRSTPRWPSLHAAAGAHVVGPSGMMDGQVGAIRTALDDAGRVDVGDHGVLGEVRLGVLRPVPRGRRLLASGRPQDLPAGPRQRPRGAPRGRPRRRRGRRHRDGQARARLPRRGPRGPRGRRRPGRGVQRVRRVRDGRGRRRQRLDHRGSGDRGDADLDPPGGRRRGPHLLGRSNGPAGRADEPRRALGRRRSRGPGPSSPAA